MNGYSTLLHNNRPSNYIAIKVALTTVALQIIVQNQTKKLNLDYKILLMGFLLSIDVIIPIHVKIMDD